MSDHSSQDPRLGMSGRIAAYFLTSPLTPLLIIGCILLGMFSLAITPREEEPQVNVTLATVMIQFPGASAKNVEQAVTVPAEQLLSQIDKVEHITSVSRPGLSQITLQFKIGVPRTEALVSLHDVIQSNRDLLPANLGVGDIIVKSKGIDDVPFMSLTLYDKNGELGSSELARIARSLESELKQINGTREVTTLGDPGRRVNIELDSARMRATGVTVNDIRNALQASNRALPAGDVIGGNRSLAIEAGKLFNQPEDVVDVVVGSRQGKPVKLSDVTQVSDTAATPDHYVWYGKPHSDSADRTTEYPAVTLTLTKKPGQDASLIGFEVKRKLDSLRNTLIPSSVEVAVTRDFGADGISKFLRLLKKLVFVTLACVALVWAMLGWREAFLVGVAISLTLLLMLFASWAVGYTLNRVSLFGFIFAVGILVDDAIVVAENIHRHMTLHPGKPLKELIPAAVDEVGGPTVLATLAVVAALLPMLNVSGIMGPYVHPIGVTPSIGMILSLGVAFVVTPWMARMVLKPTHHTNLLTAKATPILKKISPYFLSEPHGKRNRILFMLMMPVLIALVCLLPALNVVTIRAMPFENRNEFQLVVDLPPDSPVEQTAQLLRELSQYLATVPEVSEYQAYAGLPAPIDFNGLVRQYYLRQSGELGMIQVNLIDKHERDISSHDLAARVRPELHRIAERHHAVLRLVEPPPGPSSLASVAAEIYGPDDQKRQDIANQVKGVLAGVDGIMDVFDSSVQAKPKQVLLVDRSKAARLGVTQADIVATLRTGLGGDDVAYLHDESKHPAPLRVQLPVAERGSLDDVLKLTVRAASGKLVPISELVTVQEELRDQPIFHKDLRPVVFVGAEMGGKYDSPLYAMFPSREKIQAIQTPNGAPFEDHLFFVPHDTQSNFSMKWDGEWIITYEAFRDMGSAFVVALILIYLLIVAHFKSYVVPVIIMVPIPLTIIGVFPGHLITGAQVTTASAISLLALAGIIVRNSILLVDFIRLEVAKGMPLREAVVQAPLTRAQPILLTALAAMLGGYFILGDQTFDGLGTGLIFGMLASTVLTLVFVPLLYYHLYHHKTP